MIIAIIAYISNECLMLIPKNTVEIPKNKRHKPTIIEIIPDENIGNIMKISPIIIERIPALLLIVIVSPPFKKLILYIN